MEPPHQGALSTSLLTQCHTTGAQASRLWPTSRTTGPVTSKRDFDDEDASVHAHWALLVAGSSGWGNYRHQSDVLHAYHVLRSGGYRASHIIVMVADDLASNPDNPYPGKIYNKPGGDYMGVGCWLPT